MQGEGGGGDFAMHWYAIRGEVLITNAAIHFMRWKPGWARAGWAGHLARAHTLPTYF